MAVLNNNKKIQKNIRPPEEYKRKENDSGKKLKIVIFYRYFSDEKTVPSY